MIKKAGHKARAYNSDSRDKYLNSNLLEEEQGELDYPMFKTYLLAPSIESQGNAFLKQQSSIRFSEYYRASNTFDDDENDSSRDNYIQTRRFATLNNCSDTKSSKDAAEFNLKIVSETIIHSKH